MSLYEARDQALKDAAERFKRDTAKHEMTVLHDDGLYRHLRFQRPEKSGYWFTLVTWPQKLVVNGDVGTYVFSREEDMFEFVRSSSVAGGSPNFGYWQEKVVASGDPVIAFSARLFEMQVAEYFEEVGAEKRWPGVKAAWGEKVSGHFAEFNTEYEDEARMALRHFTYRPENASGGGDPFQFREVWEWDLSDYDWKFLWSCHAIRWGISRYDALKAPGGVKVDA